jgi:hypothetical protein
MALLISLHLISLGKTIFILLAEWKDMSVEIIT